MFAHEPTQRTAGLVAHQDAFKINCRRFKACLIFQGLCMSANQIDTADACRFFFALHHCLCMEAPHLATSDCLCLDSPGRFNTKSNVAKEEDASILNDLGRKLFFCLAILRNGCWWIFHKHSHSQKGICKAVDIPGGMTHETHVNFERNHYSHLQKAFSRRSHKSFIRQMYGRIFHLHFVKASSRTYRKAS